ncbi:hypothetical protein C4588_04765 [Candidatus Parcubacteria bacterium]|nr:MAG: hypothetical protein C4588_04765 [Candidatus Parcubacteria bacterium]
MYEKNRISSFSGLGAYYGEESPVQEIKSALPPSVAIDTGEVKQEVKRPEDYIPKKTDIVGWMGARKYLRRPRGSAPFATPIKKIEGDVYWTKTGPKFSQKSINGGNRAERVPAPVLKLRPNIKFIRDKPKIALPPVEMPSATSFEGLGDYNNFKIILPVLGLIVAGILLYRRK